MYKLREVSCNLWWAIFSTICSHLHPLRCVLNVLLASSWDHLGACRARVCSCLILSWATRISFPDRKRGNPNITFSGEYTGIFHEVLVQCIICRLGTWVASRLVLSGLILTEFNLSILFFLGCKIKKLAKFLPAGRAFRVWLGWS